MAIVLFILVFIICAICMKKKKTEEKLKPLTVKAMFDLLFSNILLCAAWKSSADLPLLPVCRLTRRDPGEPGAEQEKQRHARIQPQQLQQQGSDPGCLSEFQVIFAWRRNRAKVVPAAWISQTLENPGQNLFKR